MSPIVGKAEVLILYTYDHICREGPRRRGAIVYICLNSKEPSSSHLVSNNLIN